MQSEPRALRPFLLVATTFVVVGAAAGFAVWHLAVSRGEVLLPAARAAKAADEEGYVRPVDFLPATSAADRSRLGALVGAIRAGTSPVPLLQDEAALLAFGTAALPPFLSALARVVADPRGFAEPENVAAFQRLDGALRLLRAQRTPAEPPEPWPMAPERSVLELRARQWFGWWDRVGAPSTGG